MSEIVPSSPPAGTEEVLSDDLRSLIWQDLVDATRYVRYYQALHNRHLKKAVILQGLLLISATAGFAGLFRLPYIPESASSVASFFVAVFVVWNAVGKYPHKVAVLETVCVECSALEMEYQDLWAYANSYRLSEEDAFVRHRLLARRMDEVTNAPAKAGVADNEALNLRSAEESYQVLENIYAN